MWQVDAVTIVRGLLKIQFNIRESCLSCLSCLSCPLILAELRVSSWRIAQPGFGCWWQYVPNVYPKIPPQLGAVGYNLNFTPPRLCRSRAWRRCRTSTPTTSGWRSSSWTTTRWCRWRGWRPAGCTGPGPASSTSGTTTSERSALSATLPKYLEKTAAFEF